MYNSVQFPLISQVGAYVDSGPFVVWTKTHPIRPIVCFFVWLPKDDFIFNALRIFKVESTSNSSSSFQFSFSLRHLDLLVLLLHGHPNDIPFHMFV